MDHCKLKLIGTGRRQQRSLFDDKILGHGHHVLTDFSKELKQE